MLQLQRQLFAAAPGLSQPPELSEYITLSLGVFLGNIAMGICGFGTAILHLTVWILAQALGYNAGPLPKAVIACSCAMTIGMVPLFFLAKARTHAIKPLAISIPIAKGIAAPFGALVLKLLPARQLEAVVSVMMVVMIILINKRKLQVAAVHLQTYCCFTPATAALLPEGSQHPGKTLLTADAVQVASGTWVARGCDAGSDIQVSDLDTAEVVSNGSATSTDTDTNTDDSSSLDELDPYVQALQQPLLCEQLQSSEDIAILVQHTRQNHEAYAAAADQGASHGAATSLPYGFWGLFAIGSVTGLCTGLLGGATGIAGPPMMIMYAYLQASKDAVRGTNAVMSLVQDQWIGYYLFGLLQWIDVYLYLSAAVAGALGMLIGHSVQKLMDQRHFNAVMSVLMGICCVLMCSAAAGWISLGSEEASP